MPNYRVPPGNYRIENARWEGKFVTLGKADAIVGNREYYNSVQIVRRARVSYLPIADH